MSGHEGGGPYNPPPGSPETLKFTGQAEYMGWWPDSAWPAEGARTKAVNLKSQDTSKVATSLSSTSSHQEQPEGGAGNRLCSQED